MPAKSRVAQVHYSTTGSQPLIELVVPHGTRVADILKAQELISRELLPKLSPKGCGPCISGADFRIREELENVIRVDLAAGRLIE